MKKYKKYFGLLALLFAVAALVLSMTLTAVVSTGKVLGWGNSNNIPGIAVIFGNSENDLKPTWAGLVAFILLVVAILALLAAIAGLFAKKKKSPLKKNAALLSFLAAVCLIGAGVVMFFVVDAFKTANELSNANIGGLVSVKFTLGTGWIISAVVSIVGGIVALFPAVVKK